MRLPLFLSAALLLSACASQATLSPSFSCDASGLSSIETLICQSPELSRLDNQLAAIYGQALSRAKPEELLPAYQRGWIKGRNECWKSGDPTRCARDSYELRISELQAQYRLVAATAEVLYHCGDDNAALKVRFFPSLRPSLVAQWQQQSSLMLLQPSASGARYQGRNEGFWEHQGEARLQWGYGAESLRCLAAGE